MKTITEILDEIAVKNGFDNWATAFQRSDKYDISDYHREAAEIYANQSKANINEWVILNPDSDDDIELYPNDFDPVLCLTENNEYQVLMLVKYGVNLVSWEWDTVGLRKNQSFPIDYVKKYQQIEDQT